MKNKRIINNKGVTLVEVLISMVILTIVFMGLMQMSLLSINHNLRNAARDEATRIASQDLADARSLSFASILSAATTQTRMFRDLSIVYTVTRTVVNMSGTADNKQITVVVQYTFPGDAQTTYSLISLVQNK